MCLPPCLSDDGRQHTFLHLELEGKQAAEFTGLPALISPPPPPFRSHSFSVREMSRLRTHSVRERVMNWMSEVDLLAGVTIERGRCAGES